MLDVAILNVIMLSVVMPNVIMLSLNYAEGRYAKCHYAEPHSWGMLFCRGSYSLDVIRLSVIIRNVAAPL